MKNYEVPKTGNEGIEKIKPRGVISGTPGIGKSTFTEKFADRFEIFDLDPTPYRDSPDWPNNYITDILNKKSDSNLLLISAHPEVVRTLRENGIEVIVVCPDENLKAEYKERFEGRGHNTETVSMLLERGFKTNKENLANFDGSRIIFLQKGQHLSDIMDLD